MNKKSVQRDIITDIESNSRPGRIMHAGVDSSYNIIQHAGGPERYFSNGNSRLAAPCHAYGTGIARSQGTLLNESWAGPNLGPGPGSSGQMTGGGRKRNGAAANKKKSKRVGGKSRTKYSKNTKKRVYY